MFFSGIVVRNINLRYTKSNWWFEIEIRENNISFIGFSFNMMFEELRVYNKSNSCLAVFSGAPVNSIVVIWSIFFKRFFDFGFWYTEYRIIIKLDIFKKTFEFSFIIETSGIKGDYKKIV